MGKLQQLLFSRPARRILDVLGWPITLVSACWFRYIRARALTDMPLTRSSLYKIGVFPLADHYYEPLFNTNNLKPFTERTLPGIDFRLEAQLELLRRFHYQDELKQFPVLSAPECTYYYNNSSYPMGDSELLYAMIRHFRPARIIEIGCGFSTLMMQNAVRRNRTEGHDCVHTCIEPYEFPWLEKLGIDILRKKVEAVDLSFFKTLQANDLLFIDSSHMIRPQGDVLFEYLQVLPELNKGVLVHVHDIYTPFDYPETWIRDLNRFWNEQYLLEAFLSFNNAYQTLLTTHLLSVKHRDVLDQVCPIFADLPPTRKYLGAYWMQRT